MQTYYSLYKWLILVTKWLNVSCVQYTSMQKYLEIITIIGFSFQLSRMWMDWSSFKCRIDANLCLIKWISKPWCSFTLRFHILFSLSSSLWGHKKWSSHWYKCKISKEISFNAIWSLVHDNYLYPATQLVSMENGSVF